MRKKALEDFLSEITIVDDLELYGEINDESLQFENIG